MPTPPPYWTSARPFEFCDVTLLDTDVDGAVDSLVSAALAGEPQGMHLCNAYTLSLATRDLDFRMALRHAGAVNLPDGTPVSWYYRLFSGQAARGPVRGPSLMKAALARPGLRHFLLGGTEAVLRDLESMIAQEYPEAVVAGRLAPPFADPSETELDSWAASARHVEADVIWVGLGTPRQDVVISRLVGRAGGVLVGVGAAFDFLSGHKAEAPQLLHRSGLEWVYRLASEPRRLWRRYLFGNTAFVVQAARQLAPGRRRADAGS